MLQDAQHNQRGRDDCRGHHEESRTAAAARGHLHAPAIQRVRLAPHRGLQLEQHQVQSGARLLHRGVQQRALQLAEQVARRQVHQDAQGDQRGLSTLRAPGVLARLDRDLSDLLQHEASGASRPPRAPRRANSHSVRHARRVSVGALPHRASGQHRVRQPRAAEARPVQGRRSVHGRRRREEQVAAAHTRPRLRPHLATLARAHLSGHGLRSRQHRQRRLRVREPDGRGTSGQEGDHTRRERRLVGRVSPPAHRQRLTKRDQAAEGLRQQQEGVQRRQADHEGPESNVEEDAAVSEGAERLCASPQPGRGLREDVHGQDQAAVRGRAEPGDGQRLAGREDQGPHEEHRAAAARRRDQDRGQAASHHALLAAQERHHRGELAKAAASRHDTRGEAPGHAQLAAHRHADTPGRQQGLVATQEHTAEQEGARGTNVPVVALDALRQGHNGGRVGGEARPASISLPLQPAHEQHQLQRSKVTAFSRSFALL